MEGTGVWIWSGIVALFGVIGLFVAAGSHDPMAYWGGIGFFAFSVLFIMLQIRRNVGHGGGHGHH